MKEHLRALALILMNHLEAQSQETNSTINILDELIQSIDAYEEPDNEPAPPDSEQEPLVAWIKQTYPAVTGSKTIYVSASSGDDNNDGLSKTEPVKTISKGISLLRNGQPDRLLFKRGDVWVGETFGNIEISGRAEHEPLVFGSYGDLSKPRPLFDTVDVDGIRTFPQGNPLREPTSVDYLVFCGLHFYASKRDYNSPNADKNSDAVGFYWINGTKGLVLDDCKFEYYKMNIVIHPYKTKQSNVTVRNCGVFNAYSNDANSHSQGMYAGEINGLVVDNCMFDNNGHNSQAPGNTPTIYNHNIYLQKTNNNVTVTNCIITRACSHGLQLRSNNSVARHNFLYRNPIGILLGYNEQDVSAIAEHNVVTQGTEISPDLPRSWGIEFHNQNPPSAIVRNNIVVNRLDDSPNARSIEYKDRVQYAGNIVANWPPSGPFDIPGATYQNPSANLPWGMRAEDLYRRMRAFSMDNKDILNVAGLIRYYEDAFQRV